MPIRSAQILFAATLDLAVREAGAEVVQRASAEKSHRSGCSYALMSAEGALIRRLRLSLVERVARQRQRLLDKLSHQTALQRMPRDLRRKRFLALPACRRALAWALSDGQPLPQGRFGTPHLAIAVLLCLGFLLPGLVYLAWAVPRGRRYARELQALERRWMEAGQPDPVDPQFQALIGR